MVFYPTVGGVIIGTVSGWDGTGPFTVTAAHTRESGFGELQVGGAPWTTSGIDFNWSAEAELI